MIIVETLYLSNVLQTLTNHSHLYYMLGIDINSPTLVQERTLSWSSHWQESTDCKNATRHLNHVVS